MKKQLLIALAALAFAGLSCNKTAVDREANAAPLDPASQDPSAGAWKLILLSRADSFAVAAPAAASTPAYTADLNEIKGYQENLSGDDKAKIKYWAAGGVLRWNEILRGLVAKYNMPPYQNADGTYPIPSAANPFAYPLFPFANPPYAARAYAYVSAAQYDALVACWHYKMLYARKAPYAADSSVQAVNIVRSDLPSYPSEAAVLAGVTAEMMKLLFPTEIAPIQQLAQEQELAAIESGAATRSDVVAGEALGRQVAALYTARARGDNAGKAVGTPTDWSNFVTVTEARGEEPWYTLEAPSRPPMLPLFGKVKSLLNDSATLVSLRPGAPPSTSSDEFKQETEAVRAAVSNPSREDIKIVQYWADGVGTPTPPGHWNLIAATDMTDQHLSEVKWARDMALLNISLMDAAIVCWATKYQYYNPRPSQMDKDIRTLTGVPNFPAYISGHSTFSGAAATILGHLIPSRADAYTAMAREASRSRVVGGIHYWSDCNVGLQVGQSVGNTAVGRARIDGAE